MSRYLRLHYDVGFKMQELRCKVKIKVYGFNPSITDGVHRNENFEEIIPVFSTFSKKKKKYKSHFM